MCCGAVDEPSAALYIIGPLLIPIGSAVWNVLLACLFAPVCGTGCRQRSEGPFWGAFLSGLLIGLLRGPSELPSQGSSWAPFRGALSMARGRGRKHRFLFYTTSFDIWHQFRYLTPRRRGANRTRDGVCGSTQNDMCVLIKHFISLGLHQ